MTTTRRCFAGTFGAEMGYNGVAVGRKTIPFQVFYYDDRGPYISVGFYTFPGKTPTIRIDDDAPVIVKDDAVNLFRPQPEVAERLKTAHVVRARYYTWPKGAEDMVVDVSGFNEAWRQLTGLVQRP